jgi:hypothetical protein
MTRKLTRLERDMWGGPSKQSLIKDVYDALITASEVYSVDDELIVESELLHHAIERIEIEYPEVLEDQQ